MKLSYIAVLVVEIKIYLLLKSSLLLIFSQLSRNQAKPLLVNGELTGHDKGHSNQFGSAVLKWLGIISSLTHFLFDCFAHQEIYVNYNH